VAGPRPIGEITAPELLEVLRRIEARGAIEKAHRAHQNCGRVFRGAIHEHAPLCRLRLCGAKVEHAISKDQDRAIQTPITINQKEALPPLAWAAGWARELDDPMKGWSRELREREERRLAGIGVAPRTLT
jgi:hypothetical protein